MKQWLIMAITLAICCCVTLPSAYAWGVAYGRTEVIAVEGEQISFYTSLQNMDDETLEIAISIAEGKDIATVSESQATLQPNTDKYPVMVEIDIPEDAEDEYDIIVRYQLSGSGSISLSDTRELPIHIKVIQQDEPDEEPEPEKPKQNNNGGNNNNENVQQSNKIKENNDITEPEKTIETQEKPKPAVPKVEEQPEKVVGETETETTQNDSWIWLVVAIVIIIGVLVALWWLGWI
jgi:preprotein translocase subunit SecF